MFHYTPVSPVAQWLAFLFVVFRVCFYCPVFYEVLHAIAFMVFVLWCSASVCTAGPRAAKTPAKEFNALSIRSVTSCRRR